MSAPSMVSRNGDNLIVRSVVSGDPLFGTCPPNFKEDEDSFLSQPEPEEEYSHGELPQCKIKRNYSCPHCDYYTQNPRFYLYHQKQVHNQKIKIYECPHCLYASKHSQKLQRHLHMVHIMGNGKKRAVKPKKLATAAAGQQQQQQQQQHAPQQQQPIIYEAEEAEEEREPQYAEDGTQIFKCSVCSEICKTENQLARHERQIHLKRKFYRCAKCNYVTHMKARYTKHVKYHSMPMIKCEMCDFKTPYKWNLDRHNKNHTGDGAFKCSLCNFTADIKQSLTVHEMNHHIPPVGHLLSNKRRLRVGASDTQGRLAEEDQIENDELELLRMEREASFPEQANPADFVQAQLDIPDYNSDSNSPPPLPTAQFAQHSVMINRISLDDSRLITIRKYKCKMCDYEGNLGEVQRHEALVHNSPLLFGNAKKRSARPIPNLIPIQGQSVLKPTSDRKELTVTVEPSQSTKENENSLKDYVPLVVSDQENRHLDTSDSPANLTAKKIPDSFKKKNASFFDKLKEKLMTSASESNLTCSYCGYEAKCLSEHMKHQRTHMLGAENGGDSEENSRGSSSQNADNLDQLSSTRCQHCRTRFKTNAHLLQHLPNCIANQSNLPTVIKLEEEQEDDEDVDDDDDLGGDNLEINDNQDELNTSENKVFVWNTINGKADGHNEFNGSLGSDRLAEDEHSLNEDLLDQALLGVEVKPGYGVIARTLEERQRAASKELSVKKVFKCPHCSFWASTASRFHVHIVGHLNKRPFQCSLCYYSSNWRWDITKHIRLKTLRDPSHSRAKVLLTDETGRRNYSKYNKYLTTMRMELSSSGQPPTEGGGALKADGNGTQLNNGSQILQKLPRKIFPKENGPQNLHGKKRLANFFSDEDDAGGKESPPKRRHSENKRTMWKCKKCYFRDSDRSVVLAHVKEHYREAGHIGKKKFSTSDQNHNNENPSSSPTNPNSGNQDNFDNEDCPDFMCETCPFIAATLEELEAHCERHFVTSNTTHKCQFCPYYASNKQELLEHYDMHSEAEAEDSVGNKGVIYACFMCPYVATSQAQLTYHKNWHRPDNIAATHGCIRCTYGAPNNMFLSLHVRLHGRNNIDNLDTIQPNTPSKRKSMNNNSCVGERKPADISGINTCNYTEIPMVWVSKPMGISKMFKCRYCPHINMRKTNIQEHEKMHGARDIAGQTGQTAHQCTECNYVCNNPGVLSSHAKVHAAFFGTVVGVVDHTRPDDVQIEEMRDKVSQLDESYPPSQSPQSTNRSPDDNTTDSPVPPPGTSESANDEDRILHFCNLCPARFLLSKEIAIHTRFHQLELPFKCDSCSYSARQRQHLAAHIKVHSDEYQERTNSLLNVYTISEENPRPKVAVVLDDEGPRNESMWVVVKTDNNNDTNTNNNISEIQKNTISSTMQPKFLCDKCPAEFYKSVALSYHKSLHGGPGQHKCRTCDYAVKTYGNLMRHETIHQGERNNRAREAAEKQKQPKTPPPPPLQRDPEFGLLIHGSPDFVYPTYVKNGKLKEKRYKCHKCPSAFEKREQYKIHLSLHGSKQRYNCERCDYSVKYYANYAQHVKKHEMNDVSRKERKVSNGGIVPNIGGCVSGDDDTSSEWYQQEQRNRPIPPISRAGKSLKISVADQQALMVMQQRFVSNSVSDKEVDRLELYAEPTDPNHNSSEKRTLIFKDNGDTYPKKARYEPELVEDLMDYVEQTERNRGRIYINLKTGAEEIETDEPEENIKEKEEEILDNTKVEVNSSGGIDEGIDEKKEIEGDQDVGQIDEGDVSVIVVDKLDETKQELVATTDEVENMEVDKENNISNSISQDNKEENNDNINPILTPDQPEHIEPPQQTDQDNNNIVDDNSNSSTSIISTSSHCSALPQSNNNTEQQQD